MPLFTVIADYRGGTYIGQHKASDPRGALVRWAAALLLIKGSYIGAQSKRKLLTAVQSKEEALTRISGTVNVWLWHSDVLLPPIAIHIIQTEPVVPSQKMRTDAL